MYYYRCEKGTEAYRVLKELPRQVESCLQAARELATRLGAVAFVAEATKAGGIYALRFAVKPDLKKYKPFSCRREGGTKVYDCVPNSDTEEGREIAEEIARLPTLYYREILQILGAQGNPNGEEVVHFTYWPLEDWLYLCCEWECRMEGLETISQRNYEEAEAYKKGAE